MMTMDWQSLDPQMLCQLCWKSFGGSAIAGRRPPKSEPPVKTALSRNVAMGSKSYSQSRMKSSGSSERMITTDWQSLDPQVPGKEDIAHLTSHTGHSLAEPGFHILCCCHSFMHPLQLLTQCPQARLALNQDGPTFWRFECNTHCQLNALFLTRILRFFAYLRQWR